MDMAHILGQGHEAYQASVTYIQATLSPFPPVFALSVVLSLLVVGTILTVSIRSYR